MTASRVSFRALDLAMQGLSEDRALLIPVLTIITFLLLQLACALEQALCKTPHYYRSNKCTVGATELGDSP